MGQQDDSQQGDSHLTLQSVGLTLVGVLLSIGVTVGAAVRGPWWLRILVGAATSAGLIVVVGFAGRRTSALARLADFVTGR